MYALLFITIWHGAYWFTNWSYCLGMQVDVVHSSKSCKQQYDELLSSALWSWYNYGSIYFSDSFIFVKNGTRCEKEAAQRMGCHIWKEKVFPILEISVTNPGHEGLSALCSIRYQACAWSRTAPYILQQLRAYGSTPVLNNKLGPLKRISPFFTSNQPRRSFGSTATCAFRLLMMLKK